MLCESKQRIGFLGACFFIGVLVASTIIPVGMLSDWYGRRMLFLGTLATLLGACIGFLYARSLDELYVYMFLLGMTFPGRIIVATNYAQEFLPEEWIDYVQPLNGWMAGIFLILTTFYFQVCSKKIYYLEVAHIAVVAYMLLHSLVAIPESPRWLLSKERYKESKEALEKVAWINGVSRYNP